MLRVESLADVALPDDFIQIQLHPLQFFAPLISVCVFFFLLSFIQTQCVRNSHEYMLDLMEHWEFIWTLKTP